MSILSEEQFKKNFASAGVPPVTLLFGNDGYLKKQAVEKIVKRTVDQDDVFNYAAFDGDCDLQEVYDALSQLPMLADQKCVVLCDYDFEHCAKSDFDKLCALFGEACDTSVLVVWFDSIEIDPKKNTKFKKLVTAAEKNGGAVVQCDHRRAAELAKMLVDGAARRGCTMEPSAAKYLVETAGEDIHTLVNELDKLCHYRPGGTITKTEVDLVCVKTVEASIYDLSKMIFARNPEGAMKMLDELYFMRIEPMVIFYTVSAVYTDLYRVYVCKSCGKPLSEAAQTFGYRGREFVLERAAQNLRRMDFSALSRSFDLLIDADKQLKSFGGNERIVLEQLIVRLIMLVR